MPQTFTKSERLCSKKILSELFKKGSASVLTFYLFPFRVLYIPQSETPLDSESPLPAIVITVPKRMFKRAVDRNIIRRRVRETYRLNKLIMGLETTPPAYIAFLYTAKQIISFEEIEKGMKLALKKVINR
ncbi:ribonuclease P protein component [Spirosoma flavum]|uniref:Ribonuclease P protein component n=1 Tax=Spirosoma flavum TaxID=2048557 RepID=A0ABW6ASX3_9BACT